MESIAFLFKFLFILLEVVILFNLLIVVHELGHFLAARWRGLKVERFGIWFGKPLWERTYNGVKYSLGTIPAGGFVALPQMAPMEAIEGRSETSCVDLPPIGALDKIIVAFAGPLFSLGLAFLFALIIWVVGYPRSSAETSTTVGLVHENSPAEAAGILPGDRILEIDSRPVSRWSGIGEDSIAWHVVNSAGEPLTILLDRKGRRFEVEATPETPKKQSSWRRRELPRLKMEAHQSSVVGEISENSPAEKAGLLPGDRILSVDGIPLRHPVFIGSYIQKKDRGDLRLGIRSEEGTTTLDPEAAAERLQEDPAASILSIDGMELVEPRPLDDYIRSLSEGEMVLSVTRESGDLDIAVMPVMPIYRDDVEESGKRLMIGIAWKFDPTGVELARPGPWEQIRMSVEAMSNTIGALFKKDSEIGLQHLSGPVGIGSIYYRLFESDYGWRLAIWFSVLLNVNLALLNLLPIPVLDGGHIVMATVEGIFRRPIPHRILACVTNGCALLVIGFMLYVTVFDVTGLFESTPEDPPFHFTESGTSTTP